MKFEVFSSEKIYIAVFRAVILYSIINNVNNKVQCCPWPLFCSGISDTMGMPENVHLR